MLTRKQNLLETIRGGNPDRYVNQYEAFSLILGTPQDIRYPSPECGQEPLKDAWGITFSYPEGTPGLFPLGDEEHLVLKNINYWRKYVKMPSVDFTEEEWKPFVEQAKSIDREEYFVTPVVLPGIFEMCHHLMGMEECMINFYEEPELMHELIDYLTEYELKLAKEICRYLKPDALFRHDDWGSQISTFISRNMFREFLFEPTKKIYQYYKNNGVEVIIHHSDSYCETFIPEMIEMGIDIWQGAITSNNLPKIIKEYGGQITIMGGIDNGKIDREDWTEKKVEEEVTRVCNWCGNKFFIPCATMGLNISTYDGVYEAVTKAIDKNSVNMFKK